MRAKRIVSGVGIIALATVLATAHIARAQTTPSWYPVPDGATFLTGDTWKYAGEIYRLYGVQSCLRGTTIANAHGVVHDCGEISLAMLVSLIRDLRPVCYTAARAPATHINYVTCVATISRGVGAGSRIDLGTALISSGFAFAGLKADGTPIHSPYLAAQGVASAAKAGLWAFDPPDPNAVIRRALGIPRLGQTPDR